MERFVQRTGGRASDTRTEAINQERIARIRAEKGGADGCQNCPLSDPHTKTRPFFLSISSLSPVLDYHLRGSGVGLSGVGRGESRGL